ncbi:hypothetical protein FACS1894206_00330 [Deltaproteobacteria bacterium]|nr:hypothetical protein FACS1894206_00330 [Deltaproteobacteria bacterium]
MTGESGTEIYWNNGGPKNYSETDINAAIEAGIISVQAASLLKNHTLAASSEPAADEEYFRLVGGFNDIFVVIACGILLVSVFTLSNLALDGAGFFVLTLAAWGLAEYFVRKKHLALAGIVLLFAFGGGVFGVFFLLGDDTSMVACAATTLATFLHWKRFRVPVTVAAGVAAGVSLLITVITSLFPLMKTHLAPLFFCCGLAVLALAMRWDSQDRARQTRKSDVAFWLHLMASPMLVHPVFISIGVFGKEVSLLKAWLILAIYLFIAFVALAADRRALMVSSLVYVLYTFGFLFKTYGGIDDLFAVPALIIGAALLLLAAFWYPMRARVMRLLPCKLRQYLPTKVA